jgi:hypothetical protein
MIPQFTAEAGMGGPRTAYAPTAPSRGDDTTVVPQQWNGGRDGRLPDGGDAEWAPVSHECPGCFRHRCGFLGLSWCLTCC